MKFLIKTSLIFAMVVLSACSTPEPVKPEPIRITKTKVIAEPAPVPASEGVVQYCWEEPIAVIEKVRPGVDFRGEYYRPSHQAVRKVRAGKWRPCKSARTAEERRNF